MERAHTRLHFHKQTLSFLKLFHPPCRRVKVDICASVEDQNVVPPSVWRSLASHLKAWTLSKINKPAGLRSRSQHTQYASQKMDLDSASILIWIRFSTF